MRQKLKGEVSLTRGHPEITLHALIRSLNHKTMRIKRKIDAQWLTILVNLGSTHNFLDLVVVNKDEIPIDPTEKLNVRVVSGELIPSEGRCSVIRLKISGTTFYVESHVLVLSHCDMVLGIH